jgi:hypothetical protein
MLELNRREPIPDWKEVQPTDDPLLRPVVSFEVLGPELPTDAGPSEFATHEPAMVSVIVNHDPITDRSDGEIRWLSGRLDRDRFPRFHVDGDKVMI